MDYNDYLNHFKTNLNIVNNEKILFKHNKESTNINTNKISNQNYGITKFSFSLINNEEKKNNNKEICFNDQLSIINNFSKPQTILDNDSVNKSNINENYEMTTITSGKDIKDNKSNFVPENQIDLNMELRGNEKIIINPLKEYIIEEQNNNINISDKFNKYEFDKKFLEIKNDILLSIINTSNEDKNRKENSNDENLSLDNHNKTIENNNTKNINNINIFENERFCLIKDKISKNFKFDDNNLIRENNENLVIKEDNQNLKNNQKQNQKLFEIHNNYDLNFKGKKIEKCDKSTEISKELNKIEPSKHSGIILEGIEIKKEDNIFNNNEINESNENNENKIILKSKKKDINTNINYNKINEIEKGVGLEINPFEIQRTQNDSNNIFISYENKMEMLNDKDSIYKEKAKINMMKIILPIRVKSVLKQWIKKNVYKILINNLKKISFVSHLLIINNNYMNKDKKSSFEKMKEYSIMMKYKNYYLSEIGKNTIKKILQKYMVYKWNKNLLDLALLIISKKTLIFKENK